MGNCCEEMLTYFINPVCKNSRAGLFWPEKVCLSPSILYKDKSTVSPVEDVPVGELLLSGVRRGVIVEVNQLW